MPEDRRFRRQTIVFVVTLLAEKYRSAMRNLLRVLRSSRNSFYSEPPRAMSKSRISKSCATRAPALALPFTSCSALRTPTVVFPLNRGTDNEDCFFGRSDDHTRHARVFYPQKTAARRSERSSAAGTRRGTAASKQCREVPALSVEWRLSGSRSPCVGLSCRALPAP